ncbi:hypothetical protein [Chenggangzhangella methanolivorans]|uniref:Uncharacterized protein n=1 Tax=Chenggangzhangella methanolivorans TaxID=1437009 RepID=A0A9E6UNZ2_9HYPH|nr:hypothetical protein [Chenggangzhangella methanolivorans]QZN99149.1 hypothetical protein K6K41_20260 [Chenggangzhangella methanolivorans]
MTFTENTGTSPLQTTPERPPLGLGDDSREDDDPRDDVIASLQSDKENLQKTLNEYKFLSVVLCTIIFDTYFLTSANNWGTPVVIGLLQLVGLVVLAEKCSVNPINQLIEKLATVWKTPVK